jgi:metal-sulfur cluster biosynthetic enzyme
VPLVLKKTLGETIGEVEVHLTFAPPWDPATMASEDVKFELGIF